MKNNFFERHKKKSALGLLLLFLKGRGKYFLILLLALFASAPLVVTSDSFKAFTNHPAVAAALKAIGLAAPEFNDRDMIAEAAHNSAGKKSSYWQKYFRKINAPLPSGKFSSMKYLNGDIKDLGPAQINDRSKNKYGIKGVANEANEQEKGTQSGGGVDLSQLVASARGNNGAARGRRRRPSSGRGEEASSRPRRASTSRARRRCARRSPRRSRSRSP